MRPMNYLTLRQLRILSAVAKTGSMAGAGRQLHITPSAITIKMASFEKRVGGGVAGYALACGLMAEKLRFPATR
jgi:Bacterial regulatory helix-turn-helix protein, lysR family